MTFLEFKDTIEENDLAILYINFTTIIPVTVKPMTLSRKGTCEVENIYQTKYGSLKAMDLVGKKFGSKVQLSKGYGYILHVSCILSVILQVSETYNELHTFPADSRPVDKVPASPDSNPLQHRYFHDHPPGDFFIHIIFT